MADFDIIIVNYESSALTIACIDSVYQQIEANKAAIWVIDNGSSDEPEQIMEKFPNVHLQQNRKNVGFAAAANQGIEKGQAPYIVLLNPDARVEKRLFDHAVQYLSDHPDVAILGPRILDPNGTIQASARSFPTPLTALFGRQSLLSRLFPGNRFTQANLLADEIANKETPMAVDWVSGACMLVRRKAAESTGLLDRNFFMYWEDADWCRRMWNKGWKVIYYPGASVTHIAGESSRKNHIQASQEFHRSAYRLYRKHHPQIGKIWWPAITVALYLRFLIVTGLYLTRKIIGK